jgi:hypothetical protein
MKEDVSVEAGKCCHAFAEPNLPQCHSLGTLSSRPSGTPASGQTVFAARRAMSGADSCARKGFIEKHVIIGIYKRHGKILLYERYRAPNWKSRPLYILAAWMKLFAATRSKRKFNNPVSFDEKRHMRRCGSWVPSGSSANRKLSSDETRIGPEKVGLIGMWKFMAGAASKSIPLAWNQLAASDDGERTWIAIPRLSDSSLSIRTTTPTKVEFSGLSGWKSVVT